MFKIRDINALYCAGRNNAMCDKGLDSCLDEIYGYLIVAGAVILAIGSFCCVIMGIVQLIVYIFQLIRDKCTRVVVDTVDSIDDYREIV